MKKWLAKTKRAVGEIRDLLDEKTFHAPELRPLSRVHRFIHFWVLVWKSFSRNRGPARAAALAYTTLLALIPMIFVVVSVSSSILRQEGGQRVNKFIDHFLVSMTPPLAVTNNPQNEVNSTSTNTQSSANPTNTENFAANSQTNFPSATVGSGNTNAPSDANTAIASRQQLVQKINDFIRSIQSGTLGVTGIAGLIIAAILMLRSIETTFNDIWGVTQSRHWWAQVMQYSAVLLIGPTLLAVGLGLTGSQHLESAREMFTRMPFFSHLLFKTTPVVLLCLAFAGFYVVMPNTKVHWSAALVGGLVSGLLWHLNNYLSVLYVSRWITNSKIYGSLAVIPIFMAGVYISWWILLFGAQVAYAYQNRAAYLQEKQTEVVNQRGREFVALRLMECIGMRFQHAEPPASIAEIAERLAVPSRLIQQIIQNLLSSRLVVEISGLELAYVPARPLEQITCHDILLAMRVGWGQELATREEPARVGVFGEFEKIMEAEKRAASSVTLRMMVDRTEHLAAMAGKPVKAVTEGKGSGQVE
ncbi:MAG TPA: YhjD/YihY/BrkB family envelope integrity protein [Verrucomicrobiae bacterium]|nr:YhjD/YihY/BrkB family envelope integrity protein [Verrucomicrobiae bacterium]